MSRKRRRRRRERDGDFAGWSEGRWRIVERPVLPLSPVQVQARRGDDTSGSGVYRLTPEWARRWHNGSKSSSDHAEDQQHQSSSRNCGRR